jgi:BirA family biotin operon repressor/biotin-[acetyl-CoA-carboxylase] ligase
MSTYSVRVRDLVAADVLAGLTGTRFRHVEVHASLPSTQTLLMAEGGRDGRVVVADHQTAGRGRAGREWHTPPGRALTFSALLRSIDALQAPLMSLAAGLAVARAIAAVDLDPRLKWPNDVLLDNKKVCGVLGELSPSGEYIVVGIGVNVAQTADELPPGVEATSLRLMGVLPRRDVLLTSILRELDETIDRDDWLDEYRTRSATIGRPVRVVLASETFEGRASEVRDDGALVVDGRTVIAGDVVHVR